METAGIRALKNKYDAYFAIVLSEYLSLAPREKGKQRVYQVLKELPTYEEYLKMKAARFKTTVESLVGDAYSEIESLKEEMREWYDSIPENLQQADIGERVQSAADELEYIEETEVPETVGEIEVVYFPSLHASSRSNRASEAASQLQAAAEAAHDWVGEREDLEDDFEDFISTIEDHAGTLESVDFPTMFG